MNRTQMAQSLATQFPEGLPPRREYAGTEFSVRQILREFNNWNRARTYTAKELEDRVHRLATPPRIIGFPFVGSTLATVLSYRGLGTEKATVTWTKNGDPFVGSVPDAEGEYIATATLGSQSLSSSVFVSTGPAITAEAHTYTLSLNDWQDSGRTRIEWLVGGVAVAEAQDSLVFVSDTDASVSARLTRSDGFVYTIGDTSLELTAEASPVDGVEGLPWALHLGVTGGVAPYTMTASIDLSPWGIEINDTSFVSSEISEAGLAEFEATITDDEGDSVTIPVTVNFLAKGPPVLEELTWVPVPGLTLSQETPAGTVIGSYTGLQPEGILALSGASGKVTVGAGNSVTVLDLSDLSSVTWVPREILGATSRESASVTLPVSLGISITGTPDLISVGEEYLFTYTISGGQAPYSVIGSGVLPANLSHDPLAHTISGILVADASFEFTIDVEDANGATATQTFEFASASAPLQDLVLSNTDFKVGIPISGTISGATGTVTSGVPGITVTDYNYSGTPTEAGDIYYFQESLGSETHNTMLVVKERDLVDLTISLEAESFAPNTPEGTIIADVSGQAVSTTELQVVGTTALEYLAGKVLSTDTWPSSGEITWSLNEINPLSDNSPHSTSAPTILIDTVLAPLSISPRPGPFTTATPVGTIVADVSGWHPTTLAGGRSLTGTDALALNSNATAIIVAGGWPAEAGDISGAKLLETNAEASNSPYETDIPTISVGAGPEIELLSIDARGMSGVWGEPVSGPAVLAEEKSIPMLRQGFGPDGQPTMHADTLYVTARLREPYPVSTQNSRVYTDTGVVFDKNVAEGDIIAGAVNNSTIIYPRSTAAWTRRDCKVVGDEWTIGVSTIGNEQRLGRTVACVVLTVTDGETTLTQTVTQPQPYIQSGTGLCVTEYRHTFDLSVFPDGTPLFANFDVYPWFGDATSVTSSIRAIPVFATDPVGEFEYQQTAYKHTALHAAPPYAYVSTAEGDNATGVVSTDAAIAKASPFATIKAAALAIGLYNQPTLGEAVIDGGIVRVVGDHALTWASGDNPVSFGTTLHIESDPEDDWPVLSYEGTVGPNVTAAPGDPRGVGGWYARGFHIQRGSSGQLSGGRWVDLEDCTFDYGSTTNASRINGTSNTRTRVWGNFSTIGSASQNFWQPAPTSGSGGVVHWQGATATGSMSFILGMCVLGCRFASSVLKANTDRHGGPSQLHLDGFDNRGNTAANFIAGGSFGSALAPMSHMNLIAEKRNYQEGPWAGVSGDLATNSTMAVYRYYTTIVGHNESGRLNEAYDEGATPRTHPFMKMYGCIIPRSATKGDLFHKDTSRQGSWWWEYRVGSACNIEMWISGPFASTYYGRHSLKPSAGGVQYPIVFADPKFGTPTETDMGGFGDYRLMPGSPGADLDLYPANAFDIEGNPRNVGGPIGAYGVLGEP